MKGQDIIKKESQSMAILEKLIRIDSKDSNFHFKDEILQISFKVAYPQTNIENNSNEALLRQLWHHIQAHYFKKIDHEEFRRVEYLQELFNLKELHMKEQNQYKHISIPHNTHFWNELNQTLTHNFFQKIIRQSRNDQETELWIMGLYAQWKGIELSNFMQHQSRKKSRFIYSKLKQNRKQRQNKKRKKIISQLLQDEQNDIQDLLLEIEDIQSSHNNQIDRQIRKLQRDSQKNTNGISQNLYKIKKSIETENKYSENQQRNKRSSNRSNLSNLNEDLDCLQYLIKCMEEKQIAQSISKISSTERSNGQIMYQVHFEKAMNIEAKYLTESQLTRANFLRETSLFNFYRTGVKSLYSYICHNYVGFRQLTQNRMHITPKMKDKCIFQMMKKGACLASLLEIQHEMQKFNTCHHCKFLYPDYLLVTCKFSSDKQAIPKINMEAICDTNINQTYQEGIHKNRTSKRFMTRKKNCLTSYAKIHDEYVCGRKYCLSCIKDNYTNDSIKQNGLCPFCEGTCTCTRCLRNQKIAKFKNMYCQLGGDLVKIQSESQLEQLQVKSDQQMARGRGRPKKYINSHIAINTTQKKLRRFDQKQNLSSKTFYLSKKLKKKNSFSAVWYSLSNLAKNKITEARPKQKQILKERKKIEFKIKQNQIGTHEMYVEINSLF